MSGQKLGHQVKSLEILVYNLDAFMMKLRQNVCFENM